MTVSYRFLLVSALAITIGLSTTTLPVHAQMSLKESLSTLSNVANEAGIPDRGSAEEILVDIINWLLAISAIVALGALIWGGFSYITSLGDEKKVDKAKNIIKYAVIGLIVILLSFVILTAVRSLVGGS